MRFFHFKGWGQRKSFSDGKVHLAYKNFLGYKKGENGKLEIIEEEAKTVRKIYQLLVKGMTNRLDSKTPN